MRAIGCFRVRCEQRRHLRFDGASSWSRMRRALEMRLVTHPERHPPAIAFTEAGYLPGSRQA